MADAPIRSKMPTASMRRYAAFQAVNVLEQ
jgi:hypothetical protein